MSDGYIITDGWAGLGFFPVKILGETPKRYRVQLVERCRLPGRNKTGNAGDVILAPKGAVRQGQLVKVNGDWKPKGTGNG